MIRHFVIAFVVTVAALLAYWTYQGRFSAVPMKKVDAVAAALQA
jgi:phosphoglycerol transferase MdoB-like AlkP superfamily enzyme